MYPSEKSREKFETKKKTWYSGQFSVKTQAETGVIHLQFKEMLKIVSSHQNLEEARMDSPGNPGEGVHHCQNLTFRFMLC